MKIEIKIDEGCTETKIIVVTSKVTEEVNEIVKRLSSEQPQMIAAFKDAQATMLEPTQIYRVYTALGVLSYVAIFVAIFVVVWLSQYLLWKRKIKQMNTLVNKDQ